MAQIALTALSLPNLNDTHWTAHASCVIGLVAGSLVAFCSCVLQNQMSGLHTAQAVRDWLTRPLETWSNLRQYYANGQKLTSQIDDLQFNTIPNTNDLIALERTLLVKETLNELTYRPSISAAMILTAPLQLLNVALGSLLTGFGIYFGFIYSAKLPAILGQDSALGVLLVYILSVVYGLAIFYFPMLTRTAASIRDRSQRNPVKERIHVLESALQKYRAAQSAGTIPRHEKVLSASTR